MMTVHCRALMTGALICMVAAAHAQTSVDAQPLRSSRYQLKLDGLATAQTPQLYLGSASVAPNRGFPWAVSIGIKDTKPELGHFCGGVLVESMWVITAAHCVSTIGADGAVTSTEAAKVQVLTGSNVLFKGGQINSVSQIVVHPQYRFTVGGAPANDYAMVQLTQAVTLGPIRIATEAQAAAFLEDGKKIRTLGWGTASFAPDGPLSNNLLYAFTTVVGRSKCNEPAVFDGKVEDSMFCAGVGTAFYGCQGDSGGPAVSYKDSEPYLVGLVSWGEGCGGPRPTVYANVVKHAGWIYETIGRSK